MGNPPGEEVNRKSGQGLREAFSCYKGRGAGRASEEQRETKGSARGRNRTRARRPGGVSAGRGPRRPGGRRPRAPATATRGRRPELENTGQWVSPEVSLGGPVSHPAS